MATKKVTEPSRTASKNNAVWDRREEESRRQYDLNTEAGCKQYTGKWLLANEIAVMIANRYDLPYTTNRWRAMITGIVLQVLHVGLGNHRGGQKIYKIVSPSKQIIAVLSGPKNVEMDKILDNFHSGYKGTEKDLDKLAACFVDVLVEFHGFNRQPTDPVIEFQFKGKNSHVKSS